MMTKTSSTPLSAQEHRVVASAIRGLGDKEIAREMGIAFDTVRTYWARIREKAGGATRAEVIARVVQALTEDQINAMQEEKAALEAEVLRRELAEARLQAILDAMPLGAFFTDGQGGVSYVNRAWAEKMGVPFEDALRFDIAAHIHPDDRERLYGGLRQCVRNREPFRDEHRIVRDDGRTVWVSMRIAPVQIPTELAAFVGTIENITARRAQEEALQRAERELRAVADLLPEIVLMADGKGVIQFANEWAYRYFGKDLDGLRYGRWIEAVHPDDAGSVVPFIARSKDAIGPLEQEIRIRRAEDGQYRWHLARMRPEFGPNGEIVRWVGVFNDIHSLHEAGERLNRRQEQLNEAQRIAKIGSYLYDPETGTTEWSDELFRIFAMSPSEPPLRGEAFLARVVPEDLPQLRAELQAWEIRNGVFHQEYRVIALDGTAKTLAAVANAQLTPTGGRRIIGTLQDVTERRALEAELRRSESALRGAADSSPDAFYIFRPIHTASGELTDFVFDFVNRRAEEHFGQAHGDLTGKPLLKTYSAEKLRTLFDTLRKVYEEGTRVEIEFEGTMAAVRGKWLCLQATRIEEGVAMTCADITAEHKHEQQLVDNLRQLHEAQVELVLRQRELEEANGRLREAANTDSLTGLRNKRRFLERLDAEIELAVQYGHTFSVLLVDIDRFREINDVYGHSEGDRVIETVAAMLRHSVQPSDFLARVSGDRFAIVVPEAGIDQARKAAHAVWRAIGNHAWPRYPVTVSVGTATCAGDIETAESIDNRAQAALENAKSEGRNRVASFEEGGNLPIPSF